MESIVNLATGTIRDLLVEEAKFLYGVKDQVESMQKELIMMNSFLIDMEPLNNEAGQERLRTTAKEIRRIAYDAEDAIESYILKVARRDKDSFKRYLCFCGCLVSTHQVGADIEGITKRIAETMELLKKFGGETTFTKAAGEGQKKNKDWRPAVYAHTKEDHVVGLDADIKRLAGLLTTKETQIQVLSIVGMGGCGKTTIVRKLFHHESVKQCFDSVAWVPISQQWDAQHGLLDIFKRIGGESKESDDQARGRQEIGEKLHEYLKERKYLIVLDDVWTKQALEEILPALPSGNEGSRIIVTTRFREVVDHATLKIHIHEPRELTEEESWELFRKIALNRGEESISSTELVDLEALGKEMLKKCKGLPLAVVALAGLLAKKETVEEWEKVNNAMSSRVMETGRGTQTYGAVKETLSLSYNDLPRELKPCFLYLGLFPEDYEISTGMLIRMWIAEGFISSHNLQEGETLEDLARDYLDELIGRCMVRIASRNYDGKAKTIEIHDLMRDLCIKKAKELDFLETLSDGSSDPDTTVTQTRRTVVHSNNDEVFCPFSTDNRHLRSLFLFAKRYPGFIGRTFYGSAELSCKPILKNFKLLRVLNLVAIVTSDGTLPKQIGSLILLRYLGVRYTNIIELPSSVGNLRNLLILDYRDVNATNLDGRGMKIPNVFWKIKGLRHIYLPFEFHILEELRLDTLHQLQTLSVRAGVWMLDELPKLSKTVQKLHIKDVMSSEQLEAVFRCPSIESDRLHSLDLSYNVRQGGRAFQLFGEMVRGPSERIEAPTMLDMDGLMDFQNMDLTRIDSLFGLGKGADGTVLKNLEHISNARHLRKLALKGKIDDESARIQFPSGIKKLRLFFTKLEAEETLEALGRLPNLKVLELIGDAYTGTKWACCEGMFSQLKELTIYGLSNLVEWSIERGAMRQLEELSIGDCEELTRIPEGLKFITTLKVLELKGMEEEFNSKIKEDGEDAHIIRHIPVVKFST